jgi:NADH-quinone oxidoreductase subunit N
VLPATIVACTALVALFFDLFVPRDVRRPLAVLIGAIGVIGAGVVLAEQYPQQLSAFGGAFILGGYSIVFSEIILLATLATLALGGIGRDDQVAGSTALVLWSASGAMLMAGAGNLMTIFLGLELLSLGLYCLCAISPRATAGEAALKYLLLSSVASGFLLYGMALLFGATGSVSLAVLAAGHPTLLYLLGCGLFLAGLAFKLSLVPFHVWTPDVFQGAPLPVTAFMSVATKAGTLAVLGRFIYAAIPPDAAPAILVPLWTVAAISMLVGNLAALAQTDLKRLLAYSGVAQIGYIVVAFAGQSANGIRYAIFYLAAYTFMNLGAFAVLALLGSERDPIVGLPRFAGLAYRQPWLAGAMTFFLIGLAGLPPTAGFTGKLLILATAVSSGYAWLGGILILGTAISIYVYFKIVRMMFVRADAAHVREERAASPLPWITVAICAVAVFVLGVYPLAPSNVLPLPK